MKERIAAAVCMAAALLLIAVGLLQGQQTDVFSKAIRICLECVGIG